METSKPYFHSLNKLLSITTTLKMSKRDKFVILSDVHLGNGGHRDDFMHNRELLSTILKDYYLPQKYKLILNGDIEDLQKFPYNSIRTQYDDIYRIFNMFHEKKRLFKIVGNHDYQFMIDKRTAFAFPVLQALKLDYHGETLFVFHGHQAGTYYKLVFYFSRLFLRYIAIPFGIQNRTVAYENMKQFRIEKRIYRFSNHHKIVSIVGHTHRPLFQSLSKIDFLKFKIEELCRLFWKARRHEKEEIENDIQDLKQDLIKSIERDKKHRWSRGVYNSDIVIPSLFNSGCAIGKRGITAIEIHGDKISLIYWFDRKRDDKYFSYSDHYPEQLGDSDFFRTLLKSDSLNYVFSRIKLLA